MAEFLISDPRRLLALVVLVSIVGAFVIYHAARFNRWRGERAVRGWAANLRAEPALEAGLTDDSPRTMHELDDLTLAEYLEHELAPTLIDPDTEQDPDQ